MNIDKLAILRKEADKWAANMSWSSDTKYGDMRYDQLYDMKFAELIIKECAEVYRNTVTLQKRILFPTEFSTALKNHFGVEE